MPTLLTSTAITALQLKESASPGTPSAGYGRIYTYTDNTLHYIDDTGLDVSVSAFYTGKLALTSQTTGDLIYASSSTQFGRIADVAVSQVLVSGGVGVVPAWSASPTLNALTVTTLNTYTFNQSVASGQAPTFTGTNFTGIPATAVTGTAAVLTGAAFTGNVSITKASAEVAAIANTDTNADLKTDGGATSASQWNIFRNGSHKWSFGAGAATNTADMQWYNRTGSATRMTLTEAGLLTVSGFGTHSFSAGGTGEQAISVRNTTDGTGNYALVGVGNNVAASRAYLMQFASSYATSGFEVADGAALRASGAGGLSIAASDATTGSIRLYSNNALALTLGASQAATFTGDMAIGGAAIDAAIALHIYAPGDAATDYIIYGRNASSTAKFYVTATGAATFAGAIACTNTVASAVAVASTHKVTMVIGGTTYYLLATNV